MANPATIFDIEDEGAKRRAIDEGIAAAEAGQVVSHETVRDWLLKVAKGERPPTPRSTRRKP